MHFKTIEELKSNGFTGFKTIKELKESKSALSKARGVYMVLHTGKTKPKFINPGTGGFFKGKNPNVSFENLDLAWVDDTIVVYIGKAGGDDRSATLYKRIGQYLFFGQGKSIGHYGGRYIWQIANADDLIFCWKELASQAPKEIEGKYLHDFMKEYSVLPFANLTI